jgi:Xaa-Pro aminopeptidase
MPAVPTKEEWLNLVLPPASKVGADPKLLTVTAAKALKKELKGHTCEWISANLVDKIWPNKPVSSRNLIKTLPIKYSGQSVQDKLKVIREEIREKSCWGYLICSLDEVAWLFNLRGSDIPYNPVFFSYGLVTLDKAVLYADLNMLKDVNTIKEVVEFREYSQIFKDLQDHTGKDSVSRFY